MEGFALVHVEPHHFCEFGRKLNSLRAVPGVTNVRPCYRLYSGARGAYGDFHVIVFVRAADTTELREIFCRLEAAGCHIDGYGG